MGSFTNSNLTEEPIGILVGLLLTRGGHSGRFHCTFQYAEEYRNDLGFAFSNCGSNFILSYKM